MEIYNLLNMETESLEKKTTNVFFQNDLFKTRVINLQPGQKIPDCHMDCFVMFYVVEGEVLLRKNEESATLKENHVFITGPAVLSMETTDGAKLMGVQVNIRK